MNNFISNLLSRKTAQELIDRAKTGSLKKTLNAFDLFIIAREGPKRNTFCPKYPFCGEYSCRRPRRSWLRVESYGNFPPGYGFGRYNKSPSIRTKSRTAPTIICHIFNVNAVLFSPLGILQQVSCVAKMLYIAD